MNKDLYSKKISAFFLSLILLGTVACQSDNTLDKRTAKTTLSSQVVTESSANASAGTSTEASGSGDTKSSSLEETLSSQSSSTIAVPAGIVPPESQAKPEEYFAKALFIGDSRLQSLMLYGEIYDAHFITGRGFNVGNYFSEAMDIEGKSLSAADYVASQPGKFTDIYLNFGLNELGWPEDSFISHYGSIVKDVMAANPNASVYVMAILPVSKSKSQAEKDGYVNNSMIKAFNKSLVQMCQELGVWYLDATAVVVDAEGNLPEEITTDGIHFDKSTVLKWQNYIQTHVI